MSQHDFTIDNQTFPNTRTDLNNALQALASTSSGTGTPSTTFANQIFYNTSNNTLLMRNEANDNNITILELDQSNNTVEYFKSDSIRTALIEFTDGDDALTIADGGALTTAGNLSIGGSNNELRFYEGANYVGFEAPALTGDQIWVLPTGDGSANQTITTNGSGTLSFGTLPVAGGGTGATSLTANGVIIGNGTSALTSVDMSTKGGLLVGDGSGNPSVLAVGSNDQVLTADSSTATGLKFASVGGGGGLAVESAVNNYNSSGDTTSYSYTGFDSDYDNYLVLIHGISQQGDGDLQMRFLDDGAAITGANYRQSTLGLTHNLSEKRITTETATLFTIVEQQKSGQDDTLNGFMYFMNGNGGRWDSDSSDSQGNVSPSFVYQIGCEGSNGSSRIAQGHGYINGTSANTCNGFQLIFAGGTGAYKINLTVYGVARS
jgi:hypothetical protein